MNLLSGFFCIVVSAGSLSSLDATMYRFTYFESGYFDGPNVSPYIESSTNLPALRSIPRGQDYGMEDFVYAEFEADSRYVFQSRVGYNLPGASMTVTAHIRFRSMEGKQIIAGTIDTQNPGQDFEIGVDEGRFYVEVDLLSEGESTRLSMVAPSEIEQGVWYRLVYVIRPLENQGSVHELWVDNELVASIESDLDRNEVIGFDHYGKIFVGDNLHADVFSVEVTQLPVSTFFLQQRLIRDASAYFGMPAYFGEIPPGRYATHLDSRIRRTYFGWTENSLYPELDARLRNKWIFPFHNDSFVVQGIAADPENGRVFLGMYHRTKDNVSYSYPSILVEVFVPEGRMGNVFILQTNDGAPLLSHMGGIAYWDNLVFVPGPSRGSAMNPDLYVYDLADIEPSSFDPATFEGFNPVPLPALHRYTDPLGVLGTEGRFNSLSYMDIHVDMEDRIRLNIGNFQADVPRPVHSFNLVFTDRRQPYLLQPVTVTQPNRRAQGGVFYMDVETEAGVQARRMLLSTSYADNDSVIYDSLYLSPDPQPRTTREWMRLPAGLEDMTMMGNSLWTTSESAAIYFQRRLENPWEAVFPFLMEIDITDLIDTRGFGVPDGWYVKHGLNSTIDPASDLDGDGFSVHDEYLWDTDPRDPDNYPWSGVDVNVDYLEIETSLLRFYTLERFNMDEEIWEPVEGRINVRGNGSRMRFLFPDMAEKGNFFRIIVKTTPNG